MRAGRAGLLLLLAAPASAQLKLDTNRLRPAGDPAGVLAAEGAAVPESLKWYASFTLHEAVAPLVFLYPDGTREPLVSHRLAGHLWGTLGLLDLDIGGGGGRLRFGFSADLNTAVQGGSLQALSQLGEAQKTALDAVALGDLRLRPRLGIHFDAFDAALEGDVYFPTGAAEAMNGDGSLGGGAALAGAAAFGPVTGLLRLGGRARPQTDTPFLHAGSEVWAQAGARYALAGEGVLPEDLAAELDFATFAGRPFDGPTTALEWRVGARWCAMGLLITGALGAGASRAYGVPAFRALAGVGYAPGVCGELPFVPVRAQPAVSGAVSGPLTGEGTPAEVQRVPVTEHEGEDHWGPVEPVEAAPAPAAPAPAPAAPRSSPVYVAPPTEARDFDEDGVPDAQDDCFDDPGPASNRGCPGKPAAKPASPAPKPPPGPAPASAPSKPPGPESPPDADADSVPDLLDFCPDEKGDPAKGGCP